MVESFRNNVRRIKYFAWRRFGSCLKRIVFSTFKIAIIATLTVETAIRTAMDMASIGHFTVATLVWLFWLLVVCRWFDGNHLFKELVGAWCTARDAKRELQGLFRRM
jgi:hypothetical protein